MRTRSKCGAAESPCNAGQPPRPSRPPTPSRPEPCRSAQLAAYMLHSPEDFGTPEQAAVAAFPGLEPRSETADEERGKILDTDGRRKRPSEAGTPEHLRRLLHIIHPSCNRWLPALTQI